MRCLLQIAIVHGEIDFIAFTETETDIIRTLFAKLNTLCFKDILTHCKALLKSKLLLILNTMIIIKFSSIQQ